MSAPSVLPAGAVLVGDVEGAEDLRVLGRIDGSVRLEATLVIEPGGVVEGEVRARELIVRGTLLGDGQGAERVHVEDGGRVVGDLSAPRVQLVPGAQLRGQMRIEGSGAATGDAPPGSPPDHAAEPPSGASARGRARLRMPSLRRRGGRRRARNEPPGP